MFSCSTDIKNYYIMTSDIIQFVLEIKLVFLWIIHDIDLWHIFLYYYCFTLLYNSKKPFICYYQVKKTTPNDKVWKLDNIKINGKQISKYSSINHMLPAYTAAYAAHAIVQCLHGISNWLDVNWKLIIIRFSCRTLNSYLLDMNCNLT